MLISDWCSDVCSSDLKLLCRTASFVQDNSSRSRRGVLRGLHYQNTHPQGKLVHVAHGEIFDVVVDLRPDSPDFGRWEGLTLSGYGQAASQADQADQPGPATHTQLWIPPGSAHGLDRKSVVVGTGVSGRVDHGGSRFSKKKPNSIQQ